MITGLSYVNTGKQKDAVSKARVLVTQSTQRCFALLAMTSRRTQRVDNKQIVFCDLCARLVFFVLHTTKQSNLLFVNFIANHQYQTDHRPSLLYCHQNLFQPFFHWRRYCETRPAG